VEPDDNCVVQMRLRARLRLRRQRFEPCNVEATLNGASDVHSWQGFQTCPRPAWPERQGSRWKPRRLPGSGYHECQRDLEDGNGGCSMPSTPLSSRCQHRRHRPPADVSSRLILAEYPSCHHQKSHERAGDKAASLEHAVISVRKRQRTTSIY
jgi:hypothetical protein